MPFFNVKSTSLFITIFYIGICIAQNRSVNSNNISLGPKNHPTINSLNKWNNTQIAPELKYKFQQIDNSQGLSNSSINTIFQDSDNLLWIGTWDGLNRYDGSKFKIFRPELNNENSLSNQVILKIDEDKSGQIWVSTIHGINSYDKKTNTFRRYYFTRINNPPVSESEFNMALDATKTVFCAVKDWGMGYFYKDGFQKLNSHNLPTEAVKKMVFTASGDLLLQYINGELYQLKITTEENDQKSISSIEMVSENVHEFGIIQNQKLCIISKTGKVEIWSLLDQSSVVVDERNVTNVIGNISEGLILSNKSEFLIIDISGNRVDLPWKKFLQDQKITTIFQGNENVIWVGTDGEGIFKLYPIRKSFNLITKAEVPEFSEGIIRTFTESPGNSFWVGTKGKGLFRFPSKFYENVNESLEYENFNQNNSGINNSVYALHKGRDSLIFIGTDGEGIDVFDLKKSRIVNWSQIMESDQCDYFKSTYAIYQDKKGYIWLGTNGYGMIRLKIDRDGERLKVSQFKKYAAGEFEDNSLSSNIIFSIQPRNERELWVGTRLGGLNLFNKESNSFKIFKNKRNDPQSLSNDDILCLYVDLKSKLWVGTSFGLNLLQEIGNDEEANFKRYTVKDGLPNNTIHGIVSDKRSNLWISTNFGLSNFIIDESRFINYTENEGLQNNEFADGAFYRDTDSDFVFMGGIKGFNYFLPSEIEEDLFVPDILIDKISGQNKEIPYYQNLVVSPNAISFPSINLDHDENYFDIDIAALTYIHSEKCKYAYQLIGFDSEWVNINNRRNISFTNVPPGKYSLWLKWTNSDGVWSNPTRAIDIKIDPILWRTNVAYAVYLLLFLLLLVLIYSYYQKKQSLTQNIIHQKREEEIHQNRLTFFTNVAHEFQTPLTLITGPVQKLSEMVGLSEKNQRFINMIERNSSRLLFLTQQLLEFRKAESNYVEVRVRQFDLVNLIEQIAELFDEWAIQKNIEYELDIPSLLEGWFDKDKIEKIVFNLLSNAFKYTPDNGKINLKIFIEEDFNILNIIVSNSGKGIAKEKLDRVFTRFVLLDESKDTDTDKFRTGIGLAYVKSLVTVLKGEITVSSEVDKKTSFHVLLPCSKVSFQDTELEEHSGQVNISYHLKNILEDVSNNSEDISNKLTSLDVLQNKRKVVLIVEDEKDVRVFLKELLIEKYNVLTANNGAEAVDAIKKEMPDIIISDLMMPEMDGMELCKKIRSNVLTCHIPFIMLTSKNSVIHSIEGLESGANSYIPKPFHPDYLQVKVQNLLEEKELMLKHLSKETPIESLTNSLEHDEEKDFMKKVVTFIQSNIENENLQSSLIEKELGISSSQLYRKIKYLYGFSPGDLIRTIRLKHAATLLRENILTVSQVCYQSGFNNRSYFYREFKKMYNITPKNYQLKSRSNL
ncbi:response regulator [Arenibacter sp. BSSL-BM3]|uniref:histidine kinase n=1 Tax=Arenibacter arenosicollis TaxID=2762274 RepID=A0ABR7QQT5_9FLAO|nr:two-component regulator propeller domain-containing protein [Arenibacter arenosicollis]MBC8769543.1 response regulator [Arenibacter arenosicollis]